jgi:type VI secretion system protein ImpA
MVRKKDHPTQGDKDGKRRGDAGPAAHDWMMPVSEDAPSGPDLEYDPEFVVLAGRVAARSEAQYGDFVGMPEPVNWSEIDRDCRRLMMRSKDIRLAVLFVRCRTRLADAVGLAEGLELLAAWLQAFPEAIHPRPDVDDDRDAALEIRMNALQALTDTEGLMSDVREIALPRTSATRLQLRDVERAFAHPRAADALAPESVMRQLDDLRVQHPQALAGFARAQTALTTVIGWSREHLEAYQPDLKVLERLLGRIAGAGEAAAQSATIGDEEDEEDGTVLDAVAVAVDHEPVALNPDLPQAAAPVTHSVQREALGRHGALERIREARAWFELHEPSSPVAVLLKQAERLVGKRYAEVFSAIPPELVAQWDAAEP